MTARTTDRVRRPRTAATTPAAADVGSQRSPGATAHQAPTEAEIRAVIEERMLLEAGHVVDEMDDLDAALRRVAIVASDPLVESGRQTLEGGRGVWEPVAPPPDGSLWGDLRPSEAVRLSQLVQAAAERASARCRAIVIEELVGAGVQFAAEHPDAPRVRS